MFKRTVKYLLFAPLLQYPALALANSDSDTVRQLSQQVEQLSREVDSLKKSVELLNSIRPSVTRLMPEIAERFHVMHYAGEADDWALAAHELMGIQELIGIIEKIDPVKGAMANGFLSNNFAELNAAIEHGSRKDFSAALESTVESCNGCHVAVGSPSMQVVLDAHDSLSLRHSHDLSASEPPDDHTHKH